MPPPQSETISLLQSYLEALQQCDRARQRSLASARPDLTEDFAAIERALSRLGPALFSSARQRVSEARVESPPPPAGAAPLGQPGRNLGNAATPAAPHPEAPSQFLGALPELGGVQARGPEALLERLDQHASSFERYADGAEIARGGMGSIRRVWDTDLRRHLVMKVMLSDRDRGQTQASKPPDSRLLTRFLEEAQITAQLDHPGILPVHDIGVDPEGRLYFTMPLVIGQELGKAIELMRQGQADWTRARLLTHLLTAMDAVAFAHSRGVIHRDLKPENVMVGRFGETYVMDWGLARVLGDEPRPASNATPPQPAQGSRVSTERFEQQDSQRRSSVQTLDGDVVGTPGYMAPEQARGERDQVGPRADVYSMGAILYQVLTGYRPFGDPLSKASGKALFDLILAHQLVPIRRLGKNVPGELVAIAEKAMAHNPGERYASMIEMADDLRAFLEGRVVLAYERGLVARARKWVQRNRLASVTVGLAVVGALAGTIAFIWQQQTNLSELTQERNAAQAARIEALEKSELAERARADEARQRELAELREREAQFNLEQESIQRTAAERARLAAEEQRALAKQQSEEARQSAERARHSTYAANLLAAQLALSSGNAAEAQRGLMACDPDLRGFEWEHLRQQTDSSRLSLDAHRGAVLDLALNPGEFIVSSGADGSVRFWDSASGELIDALPPPRGRDRQPFERIAVAPGSSRLALARADGELFFLEPSGKETTPAPICPQPLAPLYALEFSPDGRWLAVLRVAAGFEPARLDLFDVPNNRWVEVPSLGDDRPRTMAWDPRGRRLALGCLSGVVAVLDIERGRNVLRLVAEHRQTIAGLSFDARGAALCSVSIAGALEVYHIESGGPRLLSLKLPEADPRAICLVDVTAGIAGSDSTVAAQAQASLPALVAVGCRSGLLRLYDLDRGIEINTLRGHLEAITALAFDPLSESLVSSSADGAIKYWDPYQSQGTSTFSTQAVAELPALIFTEQDRALITWRGPTSGRRHDARTPARYTRMSPRAPLSLGPFSNSSGSRLFAVSAGAPIELSSETGLELSRGQTSTRPVRAAALSAEGTLLALCIENRGDGLETADAGRNQALIFAVPAPDAPWERPSALQLGDSVPRHVALSSQKQVLITAHADGTLVLHQLATGKSLQQVRPPALVRQCNEQIACHATARLAAQLNGQPYPALRLDQNRAGPMRATIAWRRSGETPSGFGLSFPMAAAPFSSVPRSP
jgi:serine/threonine protein kinase/WD40 repeat protein